VSGLKGNVSGLKGNVSGLKGNVSGLKGKESALGYGGRNLRAAASIQRSPLPLNDCLVFAEPVRRRQCGVS